MDSNQDIIANLPKNGADLSADLGDMNPFSDSAGPDLFEKLLSGDASQQSFPSIASNNSFTSGGGLNAQDLLNSALNKSDNSLLNPNDMETEPLKGGDEDCGGGGRTQNHEWNIAPPAASLSNPQQQQTNWMQNANTSGGLNSAQPMNSLSGVSALDAAPLNISLGGLGGRGLAGGGLNQGFSSASSLLRRKGSNTQLNAAFKMNSIHKAGRASANFKSSKSEGLLARALKAKYNSSGAFNGDPSGSIASRGSNAMLNHSPSMNAVGSGAQNASWRSGAQRTSSSSMIHQMLLNKSRNRSSSKLTSSDSTSALFSAKLKLGSSTSKSSMQDLLRLSRKQSKTQSLLRQSSAQSLLKQNSSNSLRGRNPLDVSSLLPPDHASSGKSQNSGWGGGGQANATFATKSEETSDDNMEVENLLHQSCRLYPTTDAIVESALRMDPEAVRRAVATAVEKSPTKKATNVYGYPINVALTHGASMGVLKMLAAAGPDVLLQKDGTDGSGSLGIALAAKCDLEVVNLLIQANSQCVQVADRRGNYPLHVAISLGLSFDIVKR
ncbi:MAG: hypothetical protein SGILL_001728, partial [Bacillariaceae sp.]